MKKNYVKVVAGLGLAQLVLLNMAAHAQTDSTRVLNDVVIQATKINQKQTQSGKVISVITRQQLERSSGKSVAQLLNEQASIVVNGAGSNSGLNKSVYLRGADNKYTLILLDGVLVSDPSGLGGAFDLRLLAVDQIDHIEILYGGQSTLYGSDAVAGVINIVTKKQAQNGLNINGVLAAGSYGTAKGSIGLNSRIDKFSYNLNYTHERTDGVSEAARPAGSTAYFDKDGNVQDALNAQFGIEATQRLHINPFIRYYYGNYKYDDGGFTDAANSNFVRHLNTGTNAVYLLNKGSINFNYSYENTSRNYNTQYGNSPQKGRLNFFELYLNHQLGKHLTLLAGVDNRYSRINASGQTRLDSSANLFAAYGSLYLSNVGSVFNLEAGARYNHQSNYGSNWTYSITPSVNLLPNNELKLFGTVSTSFKAPDLSALFGQYGANPSLKPEKSNNYEAGFSTQLFNNVFNLRADIYKRRVTNAIVYLTPQGYFNQDRQIVKGIEVEPSVNVGIFSFKGYYTYLKAAAITLTPNAAPQQLNFLYRRPAHTVGLLMAVQGTEKLYFNINFRHYSNRNDLFFDYSTFTNQQQQLKGYSLLDAYAEYKIISNRFKLFVDVKNILNEKYADLYGYTALGTNFNAGLSFNIHR